MWRQAQRRQGGGRDNYRKWFAEMEAAGYLTRHKISVPNPSGRGVKVETVLHFYDTPVAEDQRTNAYPGKTNTRTRTSPGTCPTSPRKVPRQRCRSRLRA